MNKSRVLSEINGLQDVVSTQFAIAYVAHEHIVAHIAPPTAQIILDCSGFPGGGGGLVQMTVLEALRIEMNYDGEYDDEAVHLLLSNMQTLQFWQETRQKLGQNQ